MIKINTPTRILTNGSLMPVMPRHFLKVKKEAPNFTLGETVECFIAKYLDGRFAVWDATWRHTNKYHVFDSNEALEEHFEELMNNSTELPTN